MKINKPNFVVRVLRNEEITLADQLREDLRDACHEFLGKTDCQDDTYLIEASEKLAIDQRIALNQYITGLKIQNFANNAAINDTITLNEEINDFIKKFNKVTKS